MTEPASSSTPEHVAAVLLAAGAATRMGRRPKCLLELGGQALIRRQVLALAQAGVAPVLVVLGHHAERIARVLEDLPVCLVHHPAPDRGQTSSLHLGLQALPDGAQAVLVALADQPLLTAQDIRDLLDAFVARPAGTQLLRPVVDGLPGNPVVFTRAVARAMVAGGPDMGGQQWQAAHPAQVLRWATPNSHYRVDVDSMDDVAALAAQTGVFLRWPGDLDEA
ncbi:MAG: nucleotidyltransferase family protein [Hydrogenophaga sp.]|nr:nucleotidyltransferase family protein [Hydrogenophaga sp.]